MRPIEEVICLMVICPKCKNEIPSIKLIYSRSIKCMSCSSDLTAKDKRYSSIVLFILVTINGVISFLLIRNWFYTGELIYLWLLILFFLFVFFESWAISLKLVKLEVAKPPQAIKSPTPPPFNIS